MVVDPIGAVGRDLTLPDRHAHFERIDREAASQEGFVAMGRRGDDDNGRLSDLEVSHSMGDRDVGAGPFLSCLFGDLVHLALGHLGIGLVLEVLNRMSAGMIPDVADKGDDSPDFGPIDPGYDLRFVERLGRNRAALFRRAFRRATRAIAPRNWRQECHFVPIVKRVVRCGDLEIDRGGEPIAEFVYQGISLGEPVSKIRNTRALFELDLDGRLTRGLSQGAE